MKASRTRGNVSPRTARGTYVYCIVASSRAPSLAGAPKGLKGLGAPRALQVPVGPSPRLKLWLIVADAPLDRFGADVINRHLSDLDWVSRAAVAHEAVVEAFLSASGVLPMKLFTIFTSDERAIANVVSQIGAIERLLDRVLEHDEWSVRVVMDRAVAARGGGPTPRVSGAAYLTRKKAQRDARTELVERSRHVVGSLYDLLAGHASGAARRAASELPAKNGPLLLDAAFLVPRSATRRFRKAAATQARALQPKGYNVSLTGPWPPYSFMQAQ